MQWLQIAKHSTCNQQWQAIASNICCRCIISQQTPQRLEKIKIVGANKASGHQNSSVLWVREREFNSARFNLLLFLNKSTVEQSTINWLIAWSYFVATRCWAIYYFERRLEEKFDEFWILSFQNEGKVHFECWE